MALIDVLNQLDDKSVLNIIRKGLYVDVPGASSVDDDAIKVSANDLQVISNSLTSLQNEFNGISTYSLNVKNLRQFLDRRNDFIKEENSLEKTISDNPSMSDGGISGSIDILSDSIQRLESKIGDIKFGYRDGSGGGPSTTNDDDGFGLMDLAQLGISFMGKVGWKVTAGGLVSAGLKLASGGLEAAGHTKSAAWADLAGTAGGMAATGATIGSVVPILGTGAGAISGGVIGAGIGIYENWGKFGVQEALFPSAHAATIDPNSAAERYLSSVAAKTMNMEYALQRETQINQSMYSYKFASYLDQTVENMNSWSGISPISSGSEYSSGGASYGGDSGNLTVDTGVLDAIAMAEGTYNTGYNTSLGHGKFLPNGVEQNLTGMTLSQILDLGNYMRKQPKNPNSSALGRYQIVGTTLKDAAKGLGMDLNTTRFDPATQDKLAMWIVRKQGLRAWEGFKHHPNYLAAAQNALQNNNTGGYSNETSIISSGGKGGTGIVTSGYGMRRHPVLGVTRMHNGADIAAPRGTSVRAFKGGIVKHASGMRGYGNTIDIDHGDGTMSRYAHLNTILVTRGSNVSSGQLIGAVGNTGVSSGPHLHFEIHVNGRSINPIEYYNNNKWIVGGQADGEQVGFGKNTGVMIQPSDKNVNDVANRNRQKSGANPYSLNREEAQQFFNERTGGNSNSGGSVEVRNYNAYFNTIQRKSSYF